MKLTKDKREDIEKARGLIIRSFSWDKTPQGKEYWDDVYNNLKKLLEPVSTSEMLVGEEYTFEELCSTSIDIILGDEELFIKGGNIGVRLKKVRQPNWEVVETYKVL